MKILVVVPAYNEASNIEKVISDVLFVNNLFDILVVNDCSKDDTAKVVSKTSIVKLVNLPFNLGIGGAVQTGMKYAARNGYDVAIQFDGDGQHHADQIAEIINPIIRNEADVVIGSRFLDKSQNFRSTWQRRVGIKIFEGLNYLMIQQIIKDNTSGFRAYNKRAIKILAEYYPCDFPEPEAIVLLGKNGFRMKEVKTVMSERKGGKSSIEGLRSIYYMIKVIFSILIYCARPRIKENENE